MRAVESESEFGGSTETRRPICMFTNLIAPYRGLILFEVDMHGCDGPAFEEQQASEWPLSPLCAYERAYCKCDIVCALAPNAAPPATPAASPKARRYRIPTIFLRLPISTIVARGFVSQGLQLDSSEIGCRTHAYECMSH